MELSLKADGGGKGSAWKVWSQDFKGGADVPIRPDKQKRGELWVPPKRLTTLTHLRGGGGGQEEYIRKLRLSYVVSRIKFSAVPRVVPLASFQH